MPNQTKIKFNQIDSTDLATKQDTLVSGTNIKTINNQSILGTGNIEIQGGSGNVDDVKVNGTSVVTDKVANIDVPTKVSELQNDEEFTTPEDVDNKIIDTSIAFDVTLNKASANAVINKVITSEIDKTKVNVVDNIVTQLPEATSLGQSVYNSNNKKIYETTYQKSLYYSYTCDSGLIIGQDGIIRGFDYYQYTTPLYSVNYSINAWSYILPIKLDFTLDNPLGGGSNLQGDIFYLTRNDDNSVIFKIYYNYTSMTGNSICFSTYKRDGTVIETATCNLPSSIRSHYYTIEISKSNYIKVIIDGKVSMAKLFEGLNASSDPNDDMYFALPCTGKITASKVASSLSVVGIKTLNGLTSYLSYGYMGPSGSSPVVRENQSNIVWNDGITIEKNKLILNSTDKKLYVYDGTNLNLISNNNYNDLINKPQINGIELEGDKSSDDLGLQNKIRQINYYNSAYCSWNEEIDENDISINEAVYLAIVQDDIGNEKFMYNGTNWLREVEDAEPEVVNLADYGITINGSYSSDSYFVITSNYLTNKNSFMYPPFINPISVFLNGILLIKGRDYRINMHTIEFINYTLKSTDSISFIA